MRAGLHVGQLLQPVPGGIGRYIVHVARNLPAADVEVVPFGAGAPSARVQSLIGTTVDLGWPRGPLRYELWHQLRRPRVDLDVDVVHAPSLAVPAVRDLPLVVTVHDVAFLREPEAFTRRGLTFHRRREYLGKATPGRLCRHGGHRFRCRSQTVEDPARYGDPQHPHPKNQPSPAHIVRGAHVDSREDD